MFDKSKFQKIYLLILSFTSGLTIMAVEISASRLIAPYFGTSTFVWTNIIGVIMIALAIGYFVGGKLSDQQPKMKLLLKIIIVACFVLFLVPFITRPLVEFISKFVLVFQSATFLIFAGSLLTVSLLFILPIVLLGIVSPFIIKLLSLIDPQVGKDAGLVFSISTVGSILGTFLPVLVFIPYFGTRKTIIIFSLILFFVALFGLLKNKWWLAVLVLILPVLAFPLPSIKDAQGAVAEDESVYQYMQVVDENNYRVLKINEGYGIFSVLNKNENNVLTGYYYDYYNLLPYLDGNEKKQDILILGLAGGTISTQLNHFFADNYELKIDGVEIDKKLIDLAEKYFGLKNDSLTVYNFDGRNFLDYTDKKYNGIILDTYANQLYISFQLTTKEFFESIKSHLKENGVVAMNVNATSTDSPLLKNITNTMQLVFKNVYQVQTRDESWNYMVLASDREIDFNNLNNLNNTPELDDIVKQTVAKQEKINYDDKFGYLTDDKAPIEHLTDWMILDYFYKSLD